MELELFEKTEIWISPIHIVDVDLGLIAEKFAGILHLDKKEIMVVDVREELITLDVLKKSVRAEDIIGKKDALPEGAGGDPRSRLTPGDKSPLRWHPRIDCRRRSSDGG